MKMNKYIFNSITRPGQYSYRHIALEDYNELAERLRKAGKELARSGDAYYHVIDALKEIREGRIQDAIIGLEVAAEELAFSVGKD